MPVKWEGLPGGGDVFQFLVLLLPFAINIIISLGDFISGRPLCLSIGLVGSGGRAADGNLTLPQTVELCIYPGNTMYGFFFRK